MPYAIVAALVVSTAVVCCVLLNSQRISTGDAQVDGHIDPISATIDGTVLQVAVKDNQAVNLGDELFRLDAVDYEMALSDAEAELSSATAAAEEYYQLLPVTATEAMTNRECL